MSERLRFHLDENVDPDIALALRRQGIDVTTTVELGMAGQPDEVQLAYVLIYEVLTPEEMKGIVEYL